MFARVLFKRAVVAVWGLVGVIVPGCSTGLEGDAVDTSSSQVQATQQQVFAVEGMTCRNCVNAVTAAIQALPGVAGVKVSLEAKQAVVTGDNTLSTEAVVAAVEKAGFHAAAAAGQAPESGPTAKEPAAKGS